ncbi:MAG: hypothetical protein LBT20_04180 [Clostridiales bacterium]|jgi:hypothetical protein|nr:hypothetical protein [Clostridiales bacterium]
MKYIKLFLASSAELARERDIVGALFSEINTAIHGRDVFLLLYKWENLNPSFTDERKQSDYEHKIDNADLFVALFFRREAGYTVEEGEYARGLIAKRKDRSGEPTTGKASGKSGGKLSGQSGKDLKAHCYFKAADERSFKVADYKNKLGADFAFGEYAHESDINAVLARIISPVLVKHGIEVVEENGVMSFNGKKVLKLKVES